jgi:hypothetical protein
MNFRRGILRIWIVATLCWVTYWVWHYALVCGPINLLDGSKSEITCPVGLWSTATSGGTRFQRLAPLWSSETMIEIALIVIGVPTAILAVGILLRWIVAGFTKIPRSN